MRRLLSPCLIVLIALLMVLPGIVYAGWGGSQTVTLELTGEGLEYQTIYTTVIDYEIVDDWYATLVVDIHPTKGTDIDVSTTYYLPIRNMLYATLGIRHGLFDSPTKHIPYLSITYRF